MRVRPSACSRDMTCRPRAPQPTAPTRNSRTAHGPARADHYRILRHVQNERSLLRRARRSRFDGRGMGATTGTTPDCRLIREVAAQPANLVRRCSQSPGEAGRGPLPCARVVTKPHRRPDCASRPCPFIAPPTNRAGPMQHRSRSVLADSRTARTAPTTDSAPAGTASTAPRRSPSRAVRPATDRAPGTALPRHIPPQPRLAVRRAR